MAAIWIVVGFLVLLMGLCVYSVAMPYYMVHRGRKVDARVVRCEEMAAKVGGKSGFYYEVTVEFYGMDGELVEKTFHSDRPVEEDSVADSRYIHKSGRFLWDADKTAKNTDIRSAGIIVLVLLGFIALLISCYVLQDENGMVSGDVGMVFGYVISVVFICVGFGMLFNRYKRARNKHNQQMIPGYVVDYVKESDTESVVYYPIYEYEIMGMKYRMKSTLGTGSRKRCAIGRKVQLIRDYETGEVVCKGDEQGSCMIGIVFGIIGTVVFVLLLCASLGVFER